MTFTEPYVLNTLPDIPTISGSLISYRDYRDRLTTILVSRFLLNLQYAEHKAHDHSFVASRHAEAGGDEVSHARSLVFERFVGSLGSAISFDPENSNPDSGELRDSDADHEDGTGAFSEDKACGSSMGGIEMGRMGFDGEVAAEAV